MTIGDALLLIVVLALGFLFAGDPDLWDLLHAAAMRAAGGTP